MSHDSYLAYCIQFIWTLNTYYYVIFIPLFEHLSDYESINLFAPELFF